MGDRRPGWDEYFMLLAEQAAKRSTCSRLHVGAVVVQNEQVVGTGYNGAPRGIEHCVHEEDTPCEISVHAEANALIHARVEPYFATEMYVTHAPCFQCAKLIINAQVFRVVFGEVYRDASGILLLQSGGVKVERVP